MRHAPFESFAFSIAAFAAYRKAEQGVQACLHTNCSAFSVRGSSLRENSISHRIQRSLPFGSLVNESPSGRDHSCCIRCGFRRQWISPPLKARRYRPSGRISGSFADAPRFPRPQQTGRSRGKSANAPSGTRPPHDVPQSAGFVDCRAPASLAMPASLQMRCGCDTFFLRRWGSDIQESSGSPHPRLPVDVKPF